jgi:hypothetical protein
MRECSIAALKTSKLAHLVVIGGTHVAWQGQPLLQAGVADLSFSNGAGRMEMSERRAGRFSVTAWFEKLTGFQLS